MTEWAALLRGVNVGGVSIRSAELAEVFRGLGFDGVRTVLASGNVLFATGDAATATELTDRIEHALGERFDYDARVRVIERSEVRRIVEAYPFEERDDRHAYVIFPLSAGLLPESGPHALLGLRGELDARVERLADGGDVVYWSVQKGMTLKSVIGKASGRGPAKREGTTRNLRTLRKLLG